MDSEESNNAMVQNFAKVDLLGKLSSVFDQLAPYDKITAYNASTKMFIIDSMRSQEKTIAHLVQVKDRMKDQIARKAS